MPLDLLFPDLLLAHDAPAALREVRLPALEKWLARADAEVSPSRGAIGALGALFGVAAPAPVAAISLAGETGRRPEGHWLRADPVHLRIDHDYVRLHDASILEVTRAEADALIAELQAHFAPDALEFQAPAPDRWYVKVPAEEEPRTTALADAFGRDVFGMLPQGSGRINWRGAITEAQMVMSGHEVNTLREEAAQPAINSIWLWGEGAAPAALEKRYSLVYSGDPYARGLGMLSGAEVRPLAARLADLDLMRESDSALVVIDTLTAPLHRVDIAGWQRHAAQLEEDWFANLRDAIQRFGEVRIILPADRETRVVALTPAARWRWFRRRLPLSAHA
jgi:hypothetical protein